jgi:drug/metabolite transporter (DMT)-like permease
MPHTQPNSKTITASLGLVVTAMVMGGQFAVCKQGIAAGLTYQDIVALRVVFANCIALPFCIMHGRRLLHHHGIGRMASITLLSGAPYSLLFYYAISLAPTAHGAVIVPGSMALLGAILGAYFLHERIGTLRKYCLIALLAGLLLMASAGLMHAGKNILLGDILFFVVALSWAIYTILFKRYGFTAMEAVSIIATGSLLYLPVYWFIYQPNISQWPISQIMLQGGYHGLLHAMLAMPLFAYAVRLLGAGSASMSMALIPVFGLAIALTFMGEVPTFMQWCGIALVLGAMLVNALWSLKKPKKNQAA